MTLPEQAQRTWLDGAWYVAVWDTGQVRVQIIQTKMSGAIDAKVRVTDRKSAELHSRH